MPTSRRHVRRRERARRRRFLAGTCVTLALLAFSLVRSSRLPSVHAPEPQAPSAVAPLVLATEPVAGAPSEAGRTVYPYSIISSGAESAQELAAAMKADPVVAEHYRNFDLSRTHVVRLTQARVAHVSYRIGARVFWTRRALLLNAGETLLTDGRYYARTRCGNQLAGTPEATSLQEPSADILNTPLPRTVGSLPPLPVPGPTSSLTPRVVAAGPMPADPDSSGVPDRGRIPLPSGGLPPARSSTPSNPYSTAAPTPGSTTRIPDPLVRPSPAADPPSDPSPGAAPFPAPAGQPEHPHATSPTDSSSPPRVNDPGDPGTVVTGVLPPADGPGWLFDPREPPGVPGIPQIPEPAVVAMLVAGGSAWLRRRWKREERV